MIKYQNLDLKQRFIGTNPVGRVFKGSTLLWETSEGYGVRWVHGDTSGAVERIGNMEYHRTLPIQSNMKRCIRKENGDIQYISDSDWTKDIDGTTIDYNAEGQDIMVEVPEHYYESYQKVENGVTYDYLILYPTVRLGKKVPKHYLGAFKSMLNRDTNKLYSTVKIDANSLYDSNGDANGSSFTYPANASTYRGGGNDTTYDSTGKTLFGRPVSNISIANFCTYAKNRGDGYALKHWESHWCLWRLFVVEYATFNCQDTFTETLTADGYHQGGLGFGLCSTTDVWSSYNNYNPIAPCGITLRLGSKTGIVKYTPAVQYSNDAYFEVPSYRGVENPFADIWEITNGLYIVGANSKNYIMTADNGWYVRDFNYGSTSTPITGFTSRTADKNLGLVQGWPTDFIWDSHGDIIPTVINTTAANTEDSTSPFRDYFWGTNTGAKRAMLGGSLNYGIRAGLAYFFVSNGVGAVYRSHGSRLLYMPPVSN